MHIIDARRKRNGEVRPDEDVLRIPTIDRIARKGRLLAQVLHLVPTEPAIAIDSTHPAHADATCERKTLGCPVDYFTHDLVSWPGHLSLILLVDEPSSGLDRITAGEIDELLLKIKHKKKTTMVIVTHDIHGARRVGDQIAVLDGGHLVAIGTAQALEQDDNPLVRALTSEKV
jgi:hypothetical protein